MTRRQVLQRNLSVGGQCWSSGFKRAGNLRQIRAPFLSDEDDDLDI